MAEWLGEGGRKMAQSDMEAPDLVYVRTMTYDLECNWKVFNDNYLVRACHRPLHAHQHAACLSLQRHAEAAHMMLKLLSIGGGVQGQAAI